MTRAARSRSGTPRPHRDRVREFYLGISDGTHGPVWAGETLALHIGLDGARGATFEDGLLESNRFLAERAGIREGTRVLDAGCGLGGSSLWLARELGARVTGITLVPEHVEGARRQAAARGTGRGSVDFQVRDYMNTGFPAASFDVVWGIESLCHSPDARAYFEHVRHLLRGGGRFVLLDLFIGRHAPELEEIREGCALGALHSVPEMAELLAAAGFEDLEVTDLDRRVRKSLKVIRKSTEQALVRYRFEEALLGTDTRQRQREARACLLCVDALLSGVLTYRYVGARRAAR